ncbi:hypothetical protein SKAU_G00144770 [Synaphobranchus kaupii]|uniref:Uncharacterized protein n=1 Tax=Synaphobranchus kaupii TaxID=118154 RepID=A0A9Q1J4B8_SYNKA|nr:hypothetical protein SKAU_G00144770 [Synaphobranchus kaupii]
MRPLPKRAAGRGESCPFARCIRSFQKRKSPRPEPVCLGKLLEPPAAWPPLSRLPGASIHGPSEVVYRRLGAARLHSFNRSCAFSCRTVESSMSEVLRETAALLTGQEERPEPKDNIHSESTPNQRTPKTILPAGPFTRVSTKYTLSEPKRATHWQRLNLRAVTLSPPALEQGTNMDESVTLRSKYQRATVLSTHLPLTSK